MDKVQTSRDPVCGTDVSVADSQHSTTHRGLVFHFCSAQCRERFALSPTLYTGAKRTADIRPIMKSRRLQFLTTAPERLRDVGEQLLRLKGVAQVQPGDDCLHLEYDLRLLMLSQVEAALAQAGLALKGGMHGFRRSWWRFTEHNELENAAASDGACCSRPPARLR